MTETFCQWQGQKDLNPRHVVLETTALPTELYPFVLVFVSAGIILSFYFLSVNMKDLFFYNLCKEFKSVEKSNPVT